jgi:ABC-type amino acid transport substrate-binding protein
MGILMHCSSFRLLLVAVAAAFHTPPVGGSRQAVAAEVAPVDALPADTNQIERLTLEQATALAELRGSRLGRLNLNGLTRLDAATAKELVVSTAWDGRLPKLTTLDADIAKTLAALEKWDGDLSSIVAIESPDSVEIAAALATRKGPLSLPKLKKISPKTLTALIEKEDVKIPLIETLELIQEPDGSPTEDFIIPTGFQTRQKARQQGR